jgi:hypothetical protein
MPNKNALPPHSVHIPVMGTGFTIDTPLKVARYGISSVVSLVDDVLIEQMRKFHCEKSNTHYVAIDGNEKDSRARRITAYLNLLENLVCKQVKKLQASSFERGSEISRYYEMLPDTPRKNLHVAMLSMKDPRQKKQLQNVLRQLAIPGSIDVNIMNKIDRQQYRDGKTLPYEFSDAAAALRGYANSTLCSSVVLSAGFNPRLYAYLSTLESFLPDSNGIIQKKIILKVSDYRSAFIQGKYLAKRGIWISEYRVESALNCGGHAFINDGYLIGPILEEFKQKKNELVEILHGFYTKALEKRNKFYTREPAHTSITVQGGVGTHDEHVFLLKNYDLNSIGWGTPFLLVPSVVNIDAEHLQKLKLATEKEVYLSGNSPLGVPFWNISTSASEQNRRHKIEKGAPGSHCPKHFAKVNTEFTKAPVCTASSVYQRLKLLHLKQEKCTKKQLDKKIEQLFSKSCICHDLAGCVTKKYGIDLKATTAVCPGPNIINFSKIATLGEMLNHIYGRMSLPISPDRPHMFIKELSIHIEYLKNEIKDASQGLVTRTRKKLYEVKENLRNGIEYYKQIEKDLLKSQYKKFIENLNKLKVELDSITIYREGISAV